VALGRLIGADHDASSGGAVRLPAFSFTHGINSVEGFLRVQRICKKKTLRGTSKGSCVGKH